MTVAYLELTPYDPLIARDGRPFGDKKGNRMRGLPWLLPSVVAGSFRTALVKAGTGDFSGDTPKALLNHVHVAGVFPVDEDTMYLPAPSDCVWDEKTDTVFRVQPIPLRDGEGVDFPATGRALQPVRLSDEQAEDDFKARPAPAWWPLDQYAQWLTEATLERPAAWFDPSFLDAPPIEMRDHVALDPQRGAAAESLLFSTANLNLSHLPRFRAGNRNGSLPFAQRFARISLAARVEIEQNRFEPMSDFDTWHPLGGERRLVHWKQTSHGLHWRAPELVKRALENTEKVRLILATPAIFAGGWKPGWLDGGLAGTIHDVPLRLVGVCNGRWKAVSGWSMQPLPETGRPGPKPIRRMVPAGSVYFFECKPGAAAALADHWLKPVSDDPQECRDGFGLAIWGTW